jgi:hypothetical protein
MHKTTLLRECRAPKARFLANWALLPAESLLFVRQHLERALSAETRAAAFAGGQIRPILPRNCVILPRMDLKALKIEVCVLLPPPPLKPPLGSLFFFRGGAKFGSV